jgi:hypothetical protein
MALNKCVINAALGHWYPKGQKRLIDSLKQHKFDGDIVTLLNEWYSDDIDKSNPYNIKISALQKAIDLGYTTILWLDCAMYATKPIQPIFDIIKKDGFYCETNGYNAAEECSDNCLNYFSISRDDAEKIKMCSSAVIGFDLTNKKGKAFAEMWIKSCKDGVFNGSRLHDGQSMDFRFKWHRQDQSAASIIINKLALNLYELGHLWNYAPHGNEKTVLLNQGMG